ncbi:hypothetical protein RCL1_007733 [Eukaryota sp. TZLM3-RCL]
MTSDSPTLAGSKRRDDSDSPHWRKRARQLLSDASDLHNTDSEVSINQPPSVIDSLTSALARANDNISFLHVEISQQQSSIKILKSRLHKKRIKHLLRCTRLKKALTQSQSQVSSLTSSLEKTTATSSQVITSLEKAVQEMYKLAIKCRQNSLAQDILTNHSITDENHPQIFDFDCSQINADLFSIDHSKLIAQKEMINDLSSKMIELSKSIKFLQSQFKTDITTSINQITSLIMTSFQKQSNLINAQLSSEKQNYFNLLTTLNSTNSELNELKSEYANLLTNSESILIEKVAKISSLTAELSSSSSIISKLNNQLMIGERNRRLLHAELMELKGNIRVFIRIRPLLRTEETKISYKILENSDGRGLEILGESRTSVMGDRVEKRAQKFEFDHIFTENCNQEIVFDQVSQLITSSMDGFKVGIFCYGQTGSGKTFTMEGSENFPGIIPRTVDLMYDTVNKRAQIGFETRIWLSIIEIYNENLFDLMCPNIDSNISPSNSKNLQNIGKNFSIACQSVKNFTPNFPQRDLEIRQVDGKTVVPGLTKLEVKTSQEVFDLLSRAQSNRRVASTLSNDRSSRSHLIFSLEIKTTDTSTNQSTIGQLNLIDLAGSERILVSGSIDDPERKKEAICINKSLTCLGNCVAAISRKDKHVPFRDSKLTWFLQQSLLADGKVLMFANLSSNENSISESLNTLRFAKKVNETVIGRALRNVV